jgi:hypothetical protein
VKQHNIFIAIAVGFCATVNAQNKSSLVPNPGNNGTGKVVRASEAATLKKPLYTPSTFDDKPPGFPNKLITRPFTQQQYDYTKRLHFGFVVSGSALDYKIISSKQTKRNWTDEKFNYFADVTALSPAMGVAALMDYRINHSFSLRLQVGPTFGERIVSFYDADKDNELNEAMPMESVLVEAAFLLKYKAMRHNDVRPYMIAGLTPYCDVAAFKDFNEKRHIYIAVNPFDLALAGGVGVDIYADYFKFSLELKYLMGTINTISSKSLYDYIQYPNTIDKMYLRAFVLSIIFE